MSIETVSYKGLQDCVKISNGTVEVIATTSVGPRILYYGFAGGANILAEYPDNAEKTALGVWKVYGGHRLWVWPEVFPATYAPDNGPIQFQLDGEFSVKLAQPVDGAGIRKTIHIRLSPSGAAVELEQTITNLNLWPIDIAPWAITVVQPGTAIVPREPFRTHDEYVTVTQALSVCAFTDLEDPRFTLGLPYILLRADAARLNPQKFGLRNKQNWCAHLIGQTLFVKRFTHYEDSNYPDYGANNEVYVAGNYMEVELLGPHKVVPTGDSLTLKEEWHLFQKVAVDAGEKDPKRIQAAIEPTIKTLF
jgi:hypothetical protein